LSFWLKVTNFIVKISEIIQIVIFPLQTDKIYGIIINMKIKKTNLFITDLDGTLLRNDLTVSPYTAETINRLIAEGMQFTVATARSTGSAVKIIEQLAINVPCVLMNGVCIYDLLSKRYINVEYINRQTALKVAHAFKSHGLEPFMYKIKDNCLSCEYTGLQTESIRKFFDERKKKYDKPFKMVANFEESCDNYVIYFTVLHKYEKLLPLSEELSRMDGIRFEFYKDIYSENEWYLEVFSSRASKYNGIRYLRENFGFTHITAFGDNLNDLPMFEASDVKIAVANAREEVKAKADFITDNNNNDGVARYMEGMV